MAYKILSRTPFCVLPDAAKKKTEQIIKSAVKAAEAKRV